MAVRRLASSGCCAFISCSTGSTCRTRRLKMRCTIRRRCGVLLASTLVASRCRMRRRCAASATCSRRLPRPSQSRAGEPAWHPPYLWRPADRAPGTGQALSPPGRNSHVHASRCCRSPDATTGGARAYRGREDSCGGDGSNFLNEGREILTRRRL
jgi:hypothetical protein